MLPRARLSIMHARRLCSATTVSIDVSRLRRATAAHVHEPATGLLRELQSRIRFQGSMTVAEYMTAALTHPVHGYYMQRDVFGKQGDFVTSPEISQIFGDLLGVWCASACVSDPNPDPTPTSNPTLTLTRTLPRCVSCWEQLGKPKRVRLVEAGPGRGTLMADVLRATTIFPAFQVAPTLTLTRSLYLTLSRTTFPPSRTPSRSTYSRYRLSCEACRGAR